MNEEILQQLHILKNLILQSIPKDHIWAYCCCAILLPLILFTVCTYIVGRLAFRDLLRENKKLSPKKKADFADFYIIPYAFFWMYYPTRFFCAFIMRLKKDLKRRKKNHD